ncbi:MAG: methionyl-tRNA formyltransferase [Deltaproteobacteria bacterium]|nr:methionyl-tRNA formyltransferase [Deltaproteobacteria bacterium]
MGPLVFLGTSEFAVPSLEALVASGETVSCAVTQPDRPRGRGRRLERSPVAAAAEALGVAVCKPERVNFPSVVADLSGFGPEFLVVVAYGQLLKAPLLAVPRGGTVNLHASLLPRHRGPSPVAATIWEGDSHAGNTTMLVDEGLDTGPILRQEAFPLDPRATRGDLEGRLAREGADLLVQTLGALREGRVVPRRQDDALATWSRKLGREMRPVDWGRSADEVRRQIHALSPVPGALTSLGGRRLKVLRVAPVEGSGEPGRVVRTEREGPIVACGRGAVALVEVQPEGRRAMGGGDFVRGGGARVGDLLEAPADD